MKPLTEERLTTGRLRIPGTAGGPVSYVNFLPDEQRRLYHVILSEAGAYVLLVGGSRLYQISPATAHVLRDAHHASTGEQEALLNRLGLPLGEVVSAEPPVEPPVRSFSLAIAQKCNMGCSYCYAQGGSFGEEPKSMDLSAALAAVEGLLGGVAAGERANLSFLGGEPLMNRAVFRAAAEAAVRIATEREIDLRLGITTNGTMLNEDDCAFFQRHRFLVTISMDGRAAVHDALRPLKNGRGSYDLIMKRIHPLLVPENGMGVEARVTVTPRNLALRETLDELLAAGFTNVGFSPMLSSPTGREELETGDLDEMLAQMIECGERFLEEIREGRRYPFSNLSGALAEIHRGTHRPYPCGAGSGYFGVSSEGGLYACHRFVGDEAFRMGDVSTGVDRLKQAEWLTKRHVARQSPCTRCWARYLCGGGCHHEVLQRGRVACDYTRGWLDFCLKAYTRVLLDRPEYFSPAA